jgi:hypothetical protein
MSRSGIEPRTERERGTMGQLVVRQGRFTALCLMGAIALSGGRRKGWRRSQGHIPSISGEVLALNGARLTPATPWTLQVATQLGVGAGTACFLSGRRPGSLVTAACVSVEGGDWSNNQHRLDEAPRSRSLLLVKRCQQREHVGGLLRSAIRRRWWLAQMRLGKAVLSTSQTCPSELWVAAELARVVMLALHCTRPCTA